MDVKCCDPPQAYISQRPSPEQKHLPVLLQLMRLTQFDRPGLPESDFANLFARCNCGLIVAHRVFHLHECMQVQKTPPVIIDLTQDSDEE